jgi:hypothetical protein
VPLRPEVSVANEENTPGTHTVMGRYRGGRPQGLELLGMAGPSNTITMFAFLGDFFQARVHLLSLIE